MNSLKVHNDNDAPIELLLEPSGHCFEMPPGSMFEVIPQFDQELELYPQGTDLMISGFVAKVIHAGEVVASWVDVPIAMAPSGEKIGNVEELRQYLRDQGEEISAQPEGALVYRDLRGKRWVTNVIWVEEHGLVHLKAAVGIETPLEREAELALAIARIHAETALPGFQLMRSRSRPELDLVYSMILFQDQHRQIATNVVKRALKTCFDMVSRYEVRLEAVAKGNPDPGSGA